MSVSQRASRRIKLLIVVIIVATVAVPAYWLTALRGTLSVYRTFDEAKSALGTSQVYGKLVGGTVRYNDKLGCVEFIMEDAHKTKALVRYSGALPSGFEHISHVVVVGKFEGDVFIARQLLTKCPTKYGRMSQR